MVYWNEKIETMNEKELIKLQTRKLKATLEYVYNNSPYYGQIMRRLNINFVDIMADPWKVLEKMPVTTKDDITIYQNDFIASRWRDAWESSGSSGKPRTIYKTRSDWDVCAELGARTFYMFGVNENNIVLSFMPYAKFAVSGFSVKAGADKANIPLISTTSFVPDEAKIYDIIKYRPDALVNFPTKLYFLGKFAQEKMGIDLTKICDGKSIRKFFVGGEASSIELKKQLMRLWGTEDYGDVIGTTEVRGVTLAADCNAHLGMHVWEDENLIMIMKTEIKNDSYEILNEVLDEGEFGADTYTTLLKPGDNCSFPLIKYHHGDGYKNLGRGCSCGRTHMLISYPCRIDRAIIEGGVKFFEKDIEGYIYSSQIEELGEWQMHFYKNEKDGTFPTELLVEDRKNSRKIREIEELLKKHLYNVFPQLYDSRSIIPLDVKIVPSGSIDLGRGKPKRFVKHY